MAYSTRRSVLWFVLVCMTVGCQIVIAQNGTDLEHRVEVLEVEVANMEDDINDMETDLDLQTNRIDNVEDDVSQNTNNIIEVINDVDDVEDTTNLLEERIGSLEEENSLLMARLNMLESTVNALDNSTNIRLDSVETDVQVLNDTVANLETDNTTSERLDAVEASVQELNETTDQRLTALEEVLIVPWDACASSPCDNGASCIDVNVDTFICTCRDGYFGVTCEESYADILFLATFDMRKVTPSTIIVFDYAVLNDGGHYDVTNGIYTVPIDGTYEFILNIASSTVSAFNAYLLVDGNRVTYGTSRGNGYDILHTVVILRLTAGQQVSVEGSSLSAMEGADGTYGMFTWFSGHLIYAS